MQAVFYHEQLGQTKTKQTHELKFFPDIPLLVFGLFKFLYKGVICIKLCIYNNSYKPNQVIFFLNET